MTTEKEHGNKIAMIDNKNAVKEDKKQAFMKFRCDNDLKNLAVKLAEKHGYSGYSELVIEALEEKIKSFIENNKNE